jgi:hypothetical protein
MSNLTGYLADPLAGSMFTAETSKQMAREAQTKVNFLPSFLYTNT